MKIKKFENLESWNRARKLTNAVYEATGTGRFTRDFGLKDQIRRASISILSNIAEGFERGGDKSSYNFWLWLRLVWRGSRMLLIKGIYRQTCLRNYPTMPMKSAG
jgi:23S rRNA-intervening sequence protein